MLNSLGSLQVGCVLPKEQEAPRWGCHFFSGALVIVKVPPLPPLEHFEEAEAGFEEPIMLEDHLVEGIEGQISTGVSMFESGDGCVETVGLIPKGRIL